MLAFLVPRDPHEGNETTLVMPKGDNAKPFAAPAE